MKTAEQMYQYTKKNHLGTNITLFIGPWLQRKHFKLIEDALSKDEEVLVAFTGRHHSEDMDSFLKADGESDKAFHNRVEEARGGKVRYFDCHGFTAYAITTAGRLIFARWVPFNNDYKSIPINNINTINPNTRILWGSLRIESFREVFSIFWTKRVVFAIAKQLQESKSDMQDGLMDGITVATQSRAYAQAGNNRPDYAQQPDFSQQNSSQQNYSHQNYSQENVPQQNFSSSDGSQLYATPKASSAPVTLEQLAERKQALDAGLISQEEYDAYKQGFLNQ